MIPVLISPVLNHPELLYRMLGSVDEKVGTLVIIDNGRGVVEQDCVFDAVSDWCDDVFILRMPSNLGVAGSWNLGIKSTPFAPWWLIVNSDAWFPAGSLAMFAREATTDALTLSHGSPPWCAFALGEEVVQSVGLFDEALHPAYFEDDDLTVRIEAAGLPIRRPGIPVHHDNSSTLTEPRYAARNASTFHANRDYYMSKAYRGDLSEGRWSLKRRRAQSWD